MSQYAFTSPQSTERRDLYLSIQYLRALAAIMVVFGHAAQPSFRSMLFAGVDLFFVISGFVMVMSGAHRKPLDFLWKRAARVMPMWWFVLCVAFALGIVIDDAFLASAFLIPTFFMNGYIAGVSWEVGWTLVLEAVFYLYFALALQARRAWLVFAIIPAAMLLNPLASHSPILHALTHPMLTEFLFGAAIAYGIRGGRRLSPWLVLVGIVLYLAGRDLGAPRALATGIPAALIFAGLVQLRPPQWRLPHFLGDASYSIYLFHYVALYVAWRVIEPTSWWFATALAGISLGCAAHLLVERHILALTNPRHVSRQQELARRRPGLCTDGAEAPAAG